MSGPMIEGVPDVSIEESEACFIFAAPGAPADARPRKKSKRSHNGTRRATSWELPGLLNHRELPEFAEARLKSFRKAWGEKEAQLENAVNAANAGMILQISKFVLDAVIDSQSRQIPAGLINAGLASSISGSTFDSVAQSVRNGQQSIIFRVHASDCHNLKAALKAIIHRGASKIENELEMDDYADSTEGRQLLNYDLQALHHHVRNHSVQRCVVFFQNSEALDPQILAELVDILVSWRDRIPFIILFEMAISVDLFQEKLARTTVRQLRGAMFESKTSRDILDILFSVSTCNGESLLFIGPVVSRMLLDQQTDRIASVKSFISALKYCYMMHFFNNPLSFLCADSNERTLQKEHADSLRSLPSFSRHMDVLSSDGRSEEARQLMQNDSYLMKEVRAIIQHSRQTIEDMQSALRLLLLLNHHTSLRPHLTHSSLYIKAFAGDLADSQIVRELLFSVRKLASDRMLGLLEELQEFSILNTKELDSSITWLRVRVQKAQQPLRSVYDAEHETTHTAVEGQKVVLAKGSKKVDPQVTAYTKLVERVDLILVSCMAKALVAPRDICFHEVLLFDGKSSCREVLAAAPRASIERALGRPHDYLACECCDVMEGQLAATQPATALAYQLYLESGATINIQDLWLAFRAIKGPENDDGGDTQEEQILALFHRALAELRYLGMLKNNKRKADHLAKMRWKGL